MVFFIRKCFCHSKYSYLNQKFKILAFVFCNFIQELKIESALLNANSSKEEVNAVHSAMTDKKSSLKILYVTPEKIAKSKRFMAKLEKTFQGN